jgi:hypothetical protein
MFRRAAMFRSPFSVPFPGKLLATLVAALLAVALVGGCSGLSLSTRVQSTWKDPKYAAGPMSRIFVVSLMKIEPGGRDAVENAIVARLETAGVSAVAAHTVLPSDPEKPGPTLAEAIKASGADGVLLVEVRAVGAYESSVGQTVRSLSPDTMASYNYLKSQNVYQPGDYRVANISSELYLPSMGKQVWTLYTNSYDASDLARNVPDFTLKLVGAMARDRMIPRAPPPAS